MNERKATLKRRLIEARHECWASTIEC